MFSPRSTPCRWCTALIAAAALTACHRNSEPPTSTTVPSAPVRVAVAELKEWPSTEEVVGTVRAKLRATIEPKVSGRITALPVTPGVSIKAGELIAQLDAHEIQARLDQALAIREQATRDLARTRELMSKRIATQAEFDAAQARERIAVGSVQEMETLLGYTRITAPFDGVVTRKPADVGDLAAPGKTIIEMEDPSALRFEADVPEALIHGVKSGTTLPVRIGASATSIRGTVVELAPVADAASRTFLVKLDLPTVEDARSGQFGRVLVATGINRAIHLPNAAVTTRGQMETVFVAVDNHAQLRIVRIGKVAEDQAEVLSGIEPGEKVIIEGGSTLRDGHPLTINP